MFGINGGELVVLLVLAFLLIGPERLPELAQQLGRLTREVKKIATGAKEKVREELGPEFDDLAALDPRQYDPRRIVREALMDDDEPARPARPRAARRPSPSGATTAAAGLAAAGAASADGAPAAMGGAASSVTEGPAGTAAAAASSAAGKAAVTPPTQVLAAARGAAPAGAVAAGAVAPATTATTALAEEAAPVAEEAPYVVPFDDEAT